MSEGRGISEEAKEKGGFKRQSEEGSASCFEDIILDYNDQQQGGHQSKVEEKFVGQTSSQKCCGDLCGRLCYSESPCHRPYDK